MIALFDDFGFDGPYVGQVKLVIERERPGTRVIDLQHDAPACNPRAAAYLLAALAQETPLDTVVLAVVDPGVGSDRRAAVVRADGRWFVGPDNGLFNMVIAQARQAEWWDLAWRPSRLSATFHGRDLFAPVAAALTAGRAPPGDLVPVAERCDSGWPTDLYEVIYIDHYGNAVTGIRAETLDETTQLSAAGQTFRHAPTFAAAEEGAPFWYGNSIGLVELAANRRSVAEVCGIVPGDRVDQVRVTE
jgi:hypothetical protein